MFAYRSLLLVLAVGVTASCTYVPKMRNESLQTENLRTQYLQNHPKGAHNAQIVRGEITKGMDLMEVLASWGVPEKRTAEDSLRKEAWLYTMRDPYSPDFTVYELLFVDRVLTGWTFDRNTSGSGVRNTEPSQTLEVPTPGPDGSFSTGRSTPRK